MDGRFLFFLAFCSLYAIVNSEETDIWSSQLAEMKILLTSLSSKMSALDTKMSELNFLEYAFKVNNVDNHLGLIKQSITNLDTRMTRIETQTSDIKDTLINIQNSACREVSTEKRAAQSSTPQRAGGEEASCHDLTRKIEDYGFKISKSQQELKDDGQRRQQAMTNLLETVKNGFTKTFQKVDILPNTEGHLRRLSSSLANVPSQLPRVLERLSGISDRLMAVQSELTTVSQQVSNGTGRSSDRVSASLIHAFELGNRVKTDLSKLVQTEPNITAARKMAKDLLTGDMDPRRPASMETLKNLTATLEKLEDTVIPLFLSVPYNFDSIHELLETIVSSSDKKKTCDFKEVFKLELKRINDNLEKGSSENCVAQAADVNEVNEFDQDENSAHPVKQKEVFENLVYVRAALSLVRTDLQKIFRQCPDNSIPTVKPLGMIIG